MNKGTLSLIAGAAFATLSLTGASAESCDAVGQFIDWRGGDAFRALRSVENTGVLEVSGLSGTVRFVALRDGFSRLEYDLGALDGIEALTPNGAWERSFSGQVDKMGDAQTAGMRRTVDQIFALSLQGKGTGNVSCLESEEKETRVFNVIRVAFEDGSFFDYFVTPEDGALAWIRERRDDEVTWTQYSDWKSVSGIMFPLTEKTIEENPGDNSIVRWEKVNANTDLPPETFEKPETTGSLLRFTDGAMSSGWIEFDFFKKRRIFIDALVNGHKTPIILDSGAEATAIDRSFAEEIGLEGTGELTADGVAGSTTVTIAAGVTIEIGNLRASDLTVIIIDLAAIGRQIGRPLPVIFGEEVFNELIVDIDYPNERLAFHRPEGFSTRGLAAPVEVVSVQGGQKEIRVSVNGLPPAPVGLDTGSGDTISFFKPWTDANAILDGITTTTSLGGGVGGNVVSLKGTVSSIEVGGTLLEDVPVTFFRSDEGSFATAEIAGNMGGTGLPPVPHDFRLRQQPPPPDAGSRGLRSCLRPQSDRASVCQGRRRPRRGARQ